jgi:hypothetical protein
MQRGGFYFEPMMSWKKDGVAVALPPQRFGKLIGPECFCNAIGICHATLVK